MAADVDFDGKVSVEEFDGMIEAAAALPRYYCQSGTSRGIYFANYYGRGSGMREKIQNFTIYTPWRLMKVIFLKVRETTN